MGSLIGALKDIGPIGIALVILIIMWVLNRQTAKLYREEIARLKEQHAIEIARQDTIHDEDMSELRTALRECRDEVRGLRNDLETERQARRTAEEDAHRLRMGVRND